MVTVKPVYYCEGTATLNKPVASLSANTFDSIWLRLRLPGVAVSY